MFINGVHDYFIIQDLLVCLICCVGRCQVNKHCRHLELVLVILSVLKDCSRVALCACSFLFVLIQKETKKSRQTRWLRPFCRANAHVWGRWVERLFLLVILNLFQDLLVCLICCVGRCQVNKHCRHLELVLVILSVLKDCLPVALCACSFLFVLIQKETKKSRQTRWLRPFCRANAQGVGLGVCGG
jgi:multisubunit Na+/H+ antiporter MnhF subunit